ncbi:MAG TPA: hypothetical protein VG028_00435 [Terriglobia bacterium]|nr:hypothetical protein [Terriglobia bacterium]
MKLPGAERAIVDMAKLRDYCLNEQHPRGRHKARVFSLALGITLADAAVLREALLNAAIEGEAVATERDDYGQRYVVDFEMTGPGGRATVRSTWIVLRQEDFPRMTSCYVL